MSEEPRETASTRVWNTTQVARAEAFAYWKEVICDSFVLLSARTPDPENFWGRLELSTFPDFELLRSEAAEHSLSATSRSIAQDDRGYFTCVVPLYGECRVEQVRRETVVRRGEVSFWENRRPVSLTYPKGARLALIRVPLEHARVFIAGDRRRERSVGRSYGGGAGRVVSEYIRGLGEVDEAEQSTAQALSRQVLPMLGSILALANGAIGPPEQLATADRDRVLSYLHLHLSDPHLDADKIAHDCQLSRRSLYRILESEDGDSLLGGDGGGTGVMATVRRLRVAKAAELLISSPTRSIASIAHACGFAYETSFYRAFRELEGCTPNEYRAARAAA